MGITCKRHQKSTYGILLQKLERNITKGLASVIHQNSRYHIKILWTIWYSLYRIVYMVFKILMNHWRKTSRNISFQFFRSSLIRMHVIFLKRFSWKSFTVHFQDTNLIFLIQTLSIYDLIAWNFASDYPILG